MYICIHTSVHTCVRVFYVRPYGDGTHTYVHVHTPLYTSVWALKFSVWVQVCVFTCVNSYVCVCVYCVV